MPRRKRELDAERTPATMTDAELDAFAETTWRDCDLPGREGWRAFYRWCEADDETRRRRAKNEGPQIVRKDNDEQRTRN